MQLDVHPLLLAPGDGEKTTDRPERQITILCDFPEIIVSRFRYEPGEKGPDPHVHRQHSDQFDPPEDGGRPLADAIFNRAGEGEPVRHETTSHLIKGELTELSVFEMTFEPEFEGVDPHTHDDLVDAFLVLEGEGEFVVGDEVRRAGPGFFLAA